jgi:hypothetical protein
MLYYKSTNPPPAPKDKQTALELDKPAELPNLRWPHLEPLKWHEDQDNRTLTLDYGIGGKSALKVTDCKANDFRIEPKEGGTVKLTWRVQRSDPDERVIGKLGGLLKRQVHATLVPSAATAALLEEAAAAPAEVAWPFNESIGADGKPAVKKPRKASGGDQPAA